jgi:uncharacterized RDD family membrane protein YckC
MTQQGDMTSREPGVSQAGQSTGQPGQPPGAVPGAPGPASSVPAEPAARQAPSGPSPYLAEGESIPEAYPAPAQPGQPRYASRGASFRPSQPVSPAQPPRPGQPDYGQDDYRPAYGQPQQQYRRPAGRPGLGGRAGPRDPALAAAWERLLASTVDWILILTVAFLPLTAPMLRIWRQVQTVLISSQTLSHAEAKTAIDNVMRSPGTTRTLLTFWLLVFGIALAYYWLLHAAWGATLGKRVLGLRVVSAADRSKITARTAGLRAAAFLLGPAIFLLVPGVDVIGGLIWVADCAVLLVDSRMQCLHDRVVGTTVVRKRWLDQQASGPSAPSPW